MILGFCGLQLSPLVWLMVMPPLVAWSICAHPSLDNCWSGLLIAILSCISYSISGLSVFRTKVADEWHNVT